MMMKVVKKIKMEMERMEEIRRRVGKMREEMRKEKV